MANQRGPTQPQRVSPGVYRGQNGQLQQMAPQAQGVGQQIGNRMPPAMQAPQSRPPMPNRMPQPAQQAPMQPPQFQGPAQPMPRPAFNNGQWQNMPAQMPQAQMPQAQMPQGFPGTPQFSGQPATGGFAGPQQANYMGPMGQAGANIQQQQLQQAFAAQNPQAPAKPIGLMATPPKLGY